MSSILDALRKLEEEKASYPTPAETPRPIQAPAREPAPRRSRSRRPARGRHGEHNAGQKLWIAVPVVIFGLGVIWAATTMSSDQDAAVDEADLVAAANTGSATLEPTASLAPAEHRDTTLDRIEADLRLAAEEPVRESRVTIAEARLATPIQSSEPAPLPVEPPEVDVVAETPSDRDSETSITEAAMAPIQVDVSPVPMEFEQEPEPLPVEEPPADVKPEPVRVAKAPPKPVEPEPAPYEEEAYVEPARTEPSENYRKAMAVSDALRDGTPLEEEAAVEEDIRRYPIMTRTVFTRLGVPELRINMLALPTERNPTPSALIDYNKVYVGESIPGTNGRARLIGVDIHGIAVDVDGERFYYPK